MKGFTKDGKFRPTGNKTKSSLKKSDVRHKKSVSNSSGSEDEMKEKKMPEIKFEVEYVIWRDGESYGIKNTLDDYGYIGFPNGFSGAIEDLGGRYLDANDIAELIRNDDESDYDEDDIKENLERATQGYAGDKQDNNTYNASALLQQQVNFGLFEMDGEHYIAFKEHSGNGDVRTGYGDDEVYNIQDADLDGIYSLLDPSVDVVLKATIKGKEETIDVRMDGGSNGYYNWSLMSGSGIPDEVEKSIAGEYDKRISKAVEEFLEKENN